MCVDDSNDWFCGVLPQQCDRVSSRCGEPTCIDNDDARIALDETKIRVAHEFCTVNAVPNSL